MEKRRDVFQAIADPTRRSIIHLLAKQSLNLNSIADHFDSSRPTISEHIKILAECGLILVTKQGRERVCEAKLEGLSEVSGWIDQYKRYWNEAFDSMDDYLKTLQSKNKKNVTAKRNKTVSKNK